MKTIYLIGFMGSGKSTIGGKLGEVLIENYLDTDREIEKVYKQNIPEIFSEKGEETFRQYETAILKKVNQPIISTGGGIVERKENIHIMKQNGTIIYLATSFKEIFKRLEKDVNRPLWNKDIADRKALYYKRVHLYEKHADEIIVTDGKSPEMIVNEILMRLRNKNK